LRIGASKIPYDTSYRHFGLYTYFFSTQKDKFSNGEKDEIAKNWDIATMNAIMETSEGFEYSARYGFMYGLRHFEQKGPVNYLNGFKEAAKNNRMEAVKYCCSKSPDNVGDLAAVDFIDENRKYKMSFLKEAATAGNWDAFEYALKRFGLEQDVIDDYDINTRSGFYIDCAIKHSKFLEKYLKFKIIEPNMLEIGCLYAIESRNYPSLKELLKYTGYSYHVIFERAIIEKRLDMVFLVHSYILKQYLIDIGNCIDGQDYESIRTKLNGKYFADADLEKQVDGKDFKRSYALACLRGEEGPDKCREIVELDKYVDRMKTFINENSYSKIRYWIWRKTCKSQVEEAIREKDRIFFEHMIESDFKAREDQYMAKCKEVKGRAMSSEKCKKLVYDDTIKIIAERLKRNETDWIFKWCRKVSDDMVDNFSQPYLIDWVKSNYGPEVTLKKAYDMKYFNSCIYDYVSLSDLLLKTTDAIVKFVVEKAFKKGFTESILASAILHDKKSLVEWYIVKSFDISYLNVIRTVVDEESLKMYEYNECIGLLVEAGLLKCGHLKKLFAWLYTYDNATYSIMIQPLLGKGLTILDLLIVLIDQDLREYVEAALSQNKIDPGDFRRAFLQAAFYGKCFKEMCESNLATIDDFNNAVVFAICNNKEEVVKMCEGRYDYDDAILVAIVNDSCKAVKRLAPFATKYYKAIKFAVERDKLEIVKCFMENKFFTQLHVIKDIAIRNNSVKILKYFE
jgi:hypothetical protein